MEICRKNMGCNQSSYLFTMIVMCPSCIILQKVNIKFLGMMPLSQYMAVCQNLVPLVNIKIAGKWMFIPLKMVLIGIDPYPYIQHDHSW
jgi:hypothetical protein